MIVHETNGLKYYQFESFCAMGIIHGFFTRLGGVSPKPMDSLNMATTVGDSAENVIENLTRMFGVFGLDLKTRYDGWQCHSRTVIAAEVPRDMRTVRPLRADGLITSNPEVTLVQRFGDCVPVLLYDPVKRVAGTYHAGWRGTVDNICEAVITDMRKLYGTNPKNLIAGIGPSIGPDHFEVKEDVAGPFRKTFGDRYAEIADLSENRIRIDLWKANRILLENMGVRKIETAGICTVCHKDEWFSHRGDRGKTGRFGVLITLGSGGRKPAAGSDL